MRIDQPSNTSIDCLRENASISLQNGRACGNLTISHFMPASGRVGKIRGLDRDGHLRKTTSVALYNGTVEKRVFSSLREFAQFAHELPPNEAFGFGLAGSSAAPLVTEAARRQLPANTLAVSRTKKFFEFRAQPGILPIDYDPQPGEEPLEMGKLVALLRDAVHELRTVTIAGKCSSSAFLYAPSGDEIVGPGGCHLFIPVADASQIPDCGRIIENRLWLRGHGCVKITGAGTMRHSTLIDGSVFSPERIFFARALCEDGLAQRLPDPGYFPGSIDGILECETFLTHVAPLTPQESAVVLNLKGAAAEESRPEAKRRREAWIEPQAAKRCDLATLRGEKVDRAAVVAGLVRNSDHMLSKDLVLYPEHSDPVTAGEVYSDPDRWAATRFADPHEPEYRDDPRIAVAMFGAGEPIIYSHAHGGIPYRFSPECRSSPFKAAPTEDGTRRRFEAVPATEFSVCNPTEWLIKKWLPDAELVLIYGAPGSGKSFLALDMVSSIALGIRWNGHSVRQKRVVYICAEGAAGFKKRISAYEQRFNVQLGENLHIIADQPDLLHGRDLDELTVELLKVHPDVIVIDTLAQVMPGGDENSSVDMGKVLDQCRNIQRTTQAMIILVHHAGKDASRGPRGWSGISAAADAIIEVSRGPIHNQAKTAKMKDDEDDLVYSFNLTRHVLGMDEEGDAISSCTVTTVPTTSAAPASRIAPKGSIQKAVYRAAHELTERRKQVEVAKIITKAVESVSHDPGLDLAKPRRDQRRANAKRALDALIEMGLLSMSNECVSLVQGKHASLSASESIEAEAAPASPASPPLRGEAKEARAAEAG